MDNWQAFDGGDQKVGQILPTASSHTANRVYTVLMLCVVGLGIGCLFMNEHLAGSVMIVAGVVGAFIFARTELSERAMLRRMRRRAAQSSGEDPRS